MATQMMGSVNCPKRSWLVVACDMPNLSEKLLTSLIEFRNTERHATVFKNNDYLEPLCAIYEPKIYPYLKQSIDEGNFSLNQCLQKLPVQKIIADDPTLLKNVNTPADLSV